MAKRLRRAWYKAFGRRSMVEPNKQSIAEVHSRMRSFSAEALLSREKHEARLDKILRDTFGIERYKAAQPQSEPYTEQDPWLDVQDRIKQLAEDLVNPRMFSVSLSSHPTIKVYLIWGHGGSLVDHQFYVYEYNSRMKRLRKSFQFNTRERAMDAWMYDRVLWEFTLFLPAD